MRVLRPVLASLVLLALSCSPGSESSGYGGIVPLPPANPPGAPLLAVLATNPDADEAGISIQENIVITFNRVIDPASVKAATLPFESPFGPVAGTYTVQGAVVTFNPAQDLPASCPIRGTVTAAVLGVDDSYVAQEFEWTFRSENHPQAIASGDGLQQARIAASAGGLIMAMWVQEVSGSFHLYSRDWQEASGWNPTAELAASSGGISHLKVFCTENNQAIAAWTEGGAAPYSIRTSRFVAGTGWTGIETLTSTAQTANLYFAVHRGGWGGAGYRTGADTYGFRYLGADGIWQQETAVGPGVLNYSIAAGANGALYTSQSVYNLGYGPYNASRWTPGAGWSTAEVGNGTALEVYGAGDNPAGGLAYFAGFGNVLIYRYNGTSWGVFESINGPDGTTLSADLASSSGGEACVAWTLEAGGTTDLMGAYVNSSSTVISLEPLETLDTTPSSPISTCTDDGEAWVFFTQAEAGAESVWRARYVPVTGWTTEEIDEDDLNASDLRADVQGDIGAAAWFRANGTTQLMVRILD